jgi:hypothetical protein
LNVTDVVTLSYSAWIFNMYLYIALVTEVIQLCVSSIAVTTSSEVVNKHIDRDNVLERK